MESSDRRFVLWMRGGIVITLLCQVLDCAPGLWGDLGYAGLMVGGGFTLGVAAAALILIKPALIVAGKRDAS